MIRARLAWLVLLPALLLIGVACVFVLLAECVAGKDVDSVIREMP